MRLVNDNDQYQRTGEQLLAEWKCTTREEKLAKACIVLMNQLNELHKEFLGENLEFSMGFCSHLDAYRMGLAALKSKSI